MNRRNKSLKEKTGPKPKFNWLNMIFLTSISFLALIGMPLYLLKIKFSWRNMTLLGLFYIATGLSITGGDHRLLSHRSYEGNPMIKFLFLVFGAAAFQNSAIKCPRITAFTIAMWISVKTHSALKRGSIMPILDGFF
jgi:fatty-acid desaturase